MNIHKEQIEHLCTRLASLSGEAEDLTAADKALLQEAQATLRYLQICRQLAEAQRGSDCRFEKVKDLLCTTDGELFMRALIASPFDGDFPTRTEFTAAIDNAIATGIGG